MTTAIGHKCTTSVEYSVLGVLECQSPIYFLCDVALLLTLMLAFNSQLSFARHILLTQKNLTNPSGNHEFHNRESNQWSGKSHQIPQLPIHPMDWRS